MYCVPTRLRESAICLLIVTGSWSVCAAQTFSSHRAAAGVVISGLTGTDSPSERVLPGLGLRLSLATSRRLALEIAADWTGLTYREPQADQVTWVYVWQLKHRLREGTRSVLFATYGASGWVQRDQGQEAMESTVIFPWVPTIGIGFERSIGPRLLLRGDAQGLIWPSEDGPVDRFRLSGALALPFGALHSGR